MKLNATAITLLLVFLTTVAYGEAESAYQVIQAHPVQHYPADAPHFVGRGQTAADYAIRNNDIQLMRLLGVSGKQPQKKSEDVAAEKRIAIEQAAKTVPYKPAVRPLSPRERVDLKSAEVLPRTNTYVAPEYTTLVKAP